MTGARARRRWSGGGIAAAGTGVVGVGCAGVRGAGRGADAGMATAELAAALPALVALVLVAVGLLAAAVGALRCEDAARLGARSAARGDAASVSVALARTDAPAGAAVTLSSAGGQLVRVRVSETVHMPGPLGRLLPAWTVSGTATALSEASS